MVPPVQLRPCHHDGVTGSSLMAASSLPGNSVEGFVQVMPFRLHRVHPRARRRVQMVRSMAVPHARIALGAQASARGNMFRIALQLDHPVIFQVGNGAILNVADMTMSYLRHAVQP